jgi:hypothetical protein
MAKHIPSTAFLNRTFYADHTNVEVVPVTSSIALEINDAWTPDRRGMGIHWDWQAIARRPSDAFSVEASRPIAAFAGRDPKPRCVRGQRAYRVDFVEVAPTHRRRGLWGAFALSIAAQRGTEIGANALVLPVFPELVAWYENLGAVRLSKRDWKVSQGLVGVGFFGDAFVRLGEYANVFEEESDD